MCASISALKSLGRRPDCHIPSPAGQLGTQDPVDGGHEAFPLCSLLRELLAARRRQRIEPRLAVRRRGPPSGGDPAAILQALQRGIQCAMLNEQLSPGCLLDGARDALSVLRSEDERPQDQQVESALQQLEAIGVLGRHLTQECGCSGWMSTQRSPRAVRWLHLAGGRVVLRHYQSRRMPAWTKPPPKP